MLHKLKTPKDIFIDAIGVSVAAGMVTAAMFFVLNTLGSTQNPFVVVGGSVAFILAVTLTAYILPTPKMEYISERK